MLPLLGYALFATSRQVIVGPEGALAALTAVTIAPLAEGDPTRYASLVATLALLMGAILLLGGVARLGFMADFFGRPVLLGYVNGIALTIIAGQLGKLLGISVTATEFFEILREVGEELDAVDWPTVLLSVVLFALMFFLRRFVPRVPASLAVVVVGIALSELLDLADHGIAVVGPIQGGLPSIEVPTLALSDVADLLLPAAAFALIAFADTTATARSFAARNHYELDANRELLGLGGANIVGGLTQAFPVSSSGSRTAVADANGVGSQAAGLATAAIVAIVALFLTGLIEPLPKAALGVVVVGAALTLFDFEAVWQLRKVRTAELGVSLAATVGVLVFGVLGGIALAIGLSIGVFVYRSARPHDAVLGEVADVDGYKDVERWETAEVVPGLVVFRFDAPLFFPNADHFRRRVHELIAAAEPKPSWVIVTAEAWSYVDTTAVSMLSQLRDELAREGIMLGIARAKGRLREIFDATGLSEEIGREYLFPTVRAAVKAFGERADGDTKP